MKHVKMLGLLAVAAAALMAFVATASATTTSPAGTKYKGSVVATSTNSELDGSVNISCDHSEVKGSIATEGTTSGTISSLSFTKCEPDTVTVVAGGSLSITSSGTVSSTGAEVTVLTHTPFFNITIHCIYKTNKTTVGTLTSSKNVVKQIHNPGKPNEEKTLGGTAVMHIGSAPIPEVATDGACGEDAEWTGDYTVTTPDYLDVD